jgi:puromycin-sensitive aminopeptidase
LVGPALERLGWEVRSGDTDLERKLRGDLIATMGNLARDGDTIDRCRELVATLLDGGSLDPEVATAALAVFARNGGADEYETLWKTYKAATTPLDQVRYLRSVAGVASETEALSTLDKVIENEVRTQDGFWVFARLLAGDAGPAVWEKSRASWEKLLAAMPGMTRTRVAEGISALSQPEVAASVHSHFAEHPLPEAARSVEQNLEKLDANIVLRERETERITAYFS